MIMTTVRDESPGPPRVITNGCSKTWSAPITLMIVTNSIVGLSSGIVTLQNLAHGPAPSMSAASYISREMFWTPATKMMKLNPSERHVEAKMTATSDQPAEVSHGTR